MAAFYKYICHWQNCGKRCVTLFDLIDHIELLHIEKDPLILEKQEASQPTHIALSYINCFFPETNRSGGIARKSNHENGSDRKQSISGNRGGNSRSINGNLIDDGLYDEDGSISDAGSDDSWSTTASHDALAENYLNRLGMNTGSGNVIPADGDDTKKRFVCPIPGCGKRYKNVNGIKYHTKHGHRKGGEEVKKSYKCHCGKSYKSQSGLRHHQNTQHGNKAQTGIANNKLSNAVTPVSLIANNSSVAPPALFPQANGSIIT